MHKIAINIKLFSKLIIAIVIFLLRL